MQKNSSSRTGRRPRNRSRPTYTRTGIPRKIRADARLERLSLPQRAQLRLWLEHDNLTYAAVVVRVRAEFGLTVGKSALGIYYQRHIRAHPEDATAAAAAAFLAALPQGELHPATLLRAHALAFSALCRPQPLIATACRLLDVVHRSEKQKLARQRRALAHQRAALRLARAPHPPRAPHLPSAPSPTISATPPPQPAPSPKIPTLSSLAFRAIQPPSSLPAPAPVDRPLAPPASSLPPIQIPPPRHPLVSLPPPPPTRCFPLRTTPHQISPRLPALGPRHAQADTPACARGSPPRPLCNFPAFPSYLLAFCIADATPPVAPSCSFRPHISAAPAPPPRLHVPVSPPA